MRKILLFSLALFLIFLFVGCFQPNPNVNPKEAFKALAMKSILLDDYHASYSTEITGKYGEGKMVVNMDFESWKKQKNSKSKIVMETGDFYGLGGKVESSYYSINGFVVSCTRQDVLDSLKMITGDLSGYFCQIIGRENYIAGQEMLFLIPQNFDPLLGLDVKYLGEKMVSGKFSCQEFEFNLNENILNKVYSSGEGLTSVPRLDLQLAKYSLCIEKETGIIVEMKLIVDQNQVQEQGNFGSMIATLKEFDKGVNDEEFRLPVSFLVDSVVCDNNNVEFNITLFKEINEIKLGIQASPYSGKPTDPINLEKIIYPKKNLFESQKIIIPAEVKGFVDLNFCYDSECYSKSCYSYFNP